MRAGSGAEAAPSANGSLRDASIRTDRVIDSHGIAHWAPEELDVASLRKGLGLLAEISTCAGCRRGEGRADCELRVCAADRDLVECAACGADGCPHAELLDHMRQGAIDADLFVKAETGDDRAFIDAHLMALRSRFPSCVLFLNRD